MKVKELVEMLKQFDQELEVVTNFGEGWKEDLAYIDTVTTCLGKQGQYKGFYYRADDELGNPIYPAVDLKELCFIG